MNGTITSRFGGSKEPYVSKADGVAYRGKARKAAQDRDRNASHWDNVFRPKETAWRGTCPHQRPGSMKCR